jgi:hypothetical protein
LKWHYRMTLTSLRTAPRRPRTGPPAAAREKVRTDIEADRDAARAAGEEEARALRETAADVKSDISNRWNQVQRTWDEAVNAAPEDIADRKAEHDLDKAQRGADRAEDGAKFAIDFAYSAVVEAEYAVLDATLARKEAEELSGQAGSTA